MEKFKKFFKDKKVDKHFKKTGGGARLTDGAPSAPSVVTGIAQGSSVDRVAVADVAAQAAIKRLYKNDVPQVSYSQKKIQMIAQRELEEERRKQDPSYAMGKLGLSGQSDVDVREFDHSDAIEEVYFTCELLGGDIALTKSNMSFAIEEFLHDQLAAEDDGDHIIPAVLLLYSLNKKPIREVAIETIGKYIQNIIENPGDLKYRRIRLSNKLYKERVASAKGGREFLSAVGFLEMLDVPKEGEPAEPFMVMDEKKADDAISLIVALECLREGQSVPLKVARNTTIFLLSENQRITSPKLSADFYDLSAAEIKKEQEEMTDHVSKLLSMRTKEMRERDEKKRQYKYKYTLLRVRLPDRYVIQATFGCYEALEVVRQLVHSMISTECQSASWLLRDTLNGNRAMDETKSLAELGIAPTGVLHLEWQEAVQGSILSEEHRGNAIPFTA